MTPSDRQRRAWARHWAEAVRGDDQSNDRRPVGLAVWAVARALGDPADADAIDDAIDLEALGVEPGDPGSVDELPSPPGGWADPWLPGLVDEQSLAGAANLFVIPRCAKNLSTQTASRRDSSRSEE